VCGAEPFIRTVTQSQGVRFKVMLTLVGADFKVVTVERSKTRSGAFFRWRCTCPRRGGDWTRSEQAHVIAEVHARLHHGAEVDRGPWVGPNQN